MLKPNTSISSGGVSTFQDEGNNFKELHHHLKQIQVSSSSSVHRISINRSVVIHKSNSRTFTRIQQLDRNVTKTLPVVLELRRQKLCLSFVKINLQAIRSFNKTTSKLQSVLRVLEKNNKASQPKNTLREIQETCHDIQSDIQRYRETYQNFYTSQLSNYVISYLRFRKNAKNPIDTCRKLLKYLQNIAKQLVELMLSRSEIQMLLISLLSLCSITASRIKDFVSLSCILYGVDFERRIRESFLPHDQCDTIKVRCDMTWFLNQLGKMKSYNLSLKLSTATLDAIRESNLSPNELSKVSLAPNRTKAVVRTLKHLYKAILEEENTFFTELIKHVRDLNAVTCSKNLESLRNMSFTSLNRSDSPNSRRCVQWDSQMSSSHQDYLFGVYMESLWGNVKKHVVGSYINSLFGNKHCMWRLQYPALVTFEQELIWQINLKLKRNGSSPQTFLDILTFLSISANGFWNQQYFFKGLHKSMGVVTKDRFRRIGEDVSSPSTASFRELMQCRACFHELLSTLQKYKFFNSQEKASSLMLVNNFLDPLVVYYQYLRWLLIHKRHQFLISATWEQYLTISTTEVKFAFLSCQRILMSLKNIFHEENFKKIGVLEELLQFLETFEESSLKVMVSQLGRRSRAAWRNHMSNKKIWKRRGNRHQVYQASPYINVVMQLTFGPLFESVEILSRNQKIELISKCTSIFVKTWMDHILEERIIFSWYGAQQLSFDFNHFVSWFESEEIALTLEEINEINSLPVIANMKSAMVLLACQPDSQKKKDEFNLLVNKHGGSSASTISQVSMESVAGVQFDEIVKSIELHDKERWLALRAKGGQGKRFLCMM